MLNDGQSKQRLLPRFFLQTPRGFEHTFAGRFYAYPSIKYLAKAEKEEKLFFGQTMPAYISAENFAVTLINLLSDKGVGNNKLEKVKFCLQFNNYKIEPETLRQLQAIASVSGDDVNIFKENLSKWFNETMDRTNGWYKNRITLISFWLGFLLALSFNVDSIRISRILATDKEARNQLVNLAIEMSKDTARYGRFIHANGDSVMEQSIVDSGFARITRDISYANLILGLGWQTDKLERQLQHKVDTADAAYQEVKDLAPIFRSLHHYKHVQEGQLTAIAAKLDTLSRSKRKLLLDSSLFARELRWRNGKNDKLLKDSVLKNRKGLDSTRMYMFKDSIRFKLGSIEYAQTKAELLQRGRYVDSLTGSRFTRVDSVYYGGEHGDDVMIAGFRAARMFEKVRYVLSELFDDFHWVGLIITALALSLGAPFWFDLLKKLVAIRGVGVKPEEKKPVKETEIAAGKAIVDPSVTSVQPAASTAADIAMQRYAAGIQSFAGVQGVYTVYDNIANDYFIQANVDTDATRMALKQKYPKITVDGITVPFKVVVSGIVYGHALPADAILNASRQNGFGSLGCIVEDVNTKERHLLSCWHVLNGTTRYDADDQLTRIIRPALTELGWRWTGGIEKVFDFGIAELFNSQQHLDNKTLFSILGITSTCSCRPVSIDDILNKIPVKFYDIFTQSSKSGILFTHAPSVPITYKDKVRVVEDVLLLKESGSKGAISRKGNSGSIVFDNSGAAIAMIIGGDKMFTYAARLSHVFDLHKELIIVN